MYPPQDGSRRRRAVHMPNSVGAICKRRALPNDETFDTLTSRPAVEATGTSVVGEVHVVAAPTGTPYLP